MPSAMNGERKRIRRQCRGAHLFFRLLAEIFIDPLASHTTFLVCSGSVAACAGAVYLLNTDLVEIRFRLALTLVYADERMSANIQRIFGSSGIQESSLKSAPLVRWSRSLRLDTLKSVFRRTALHCVKSVGCVEEPGGGSLSFEKDRMKIMPKIITLIVLIALLTVPVGRAPALATDAFAFDVVEFTARS